MRATGLDGDAEGELEDSREGLGKDLGNFKKENDVEDETEEVEYEVDEL